MAAGNGTTELMVMIDMIGLTINNQGNFRPTMRFLTGAIMMKQCMMPLVDKACVLLLFPQI